MKTWMTAVAMAWACVTAGCAVNASPEAQDQSAATSGVDPEPSVTALEPACKRFEDLGMAAAGEALKLGSSEASESVCVSIAGGALSAVAGTSCTLIEPQGFSLAGCADWYDCGGCVVHLRHDPQSDAWTLEGVSPGAACAAFDAKYYLMAGPSCDSQEGPVTP